MTRHTILRILLLAALMLGIPAPVAGQAKLSAPTLHPRANVILITLDTTRADRMGFLGSKRGLTPNLDAVAQQAVVFTRAYSHVPLTTASHTTILIKDLAAGLAQCAGPSAFLLPSGGRPGNAAFQL